jgi:hypothetical protein
MDSSGSWQGPVAGCYEHGVLDQPSGFIKERRSLRRTLVRIVNSVVLRVSAFRTLFMYVI